MLVPTRVRVDGMRFAAELASYPLRTTLPWISIPIAPGNRATPKEVLIVIVIKNSW